MSPRLKQIIDLIESNYAGRAWQGATLMGVLQRLSPHEAIIRPGPRRKCIWEHVLHAAYWKYIVRRRLVAAPKFPRSPANWPRPSGTDELAFAADLAVLDREHTLLVEAASRVRPAALDRPTSKGRRETVAMLLVGVASHDVYHTGQIQLIRAMIRRQGENAPTA